LGENGIIRNWKRLAAGLSVSKLITHLITELALPDGVNRKVVEPSARFSSLIFVLVFGCAAAQAEPRGAQALGSPRLTASDIDLVDDFSRRSSRYFWEQTDPRTPLPDLHLT
jgi:hypothetical protein